MQNRNTITLTFEDGSEKEFDILFTYQSEQTGKNYVYILDDNDEEAGVGVLEYVETSDGMGNVMPIDENDAELWEELAEVFEAYQNAADAEGACAGCTGAGSSECDGCNK